MASKRNVRFVLVFFVVLCVSISIKSVCAVEKAERISDREIIEGLATLKEGQRALNQRFDDMNGSFNRRFDELRGFMIWGFGVTFAGIFSLIGFVLWDRRSALAPAIRKNKELEEREEELERWKRKADTVLKEYAGQDVRLADIMKHAGML